MCGIAGVMNFSGEPVNEFLLKAMGDALAHRGPDGDGFFIRQHVGLAHRRLSIIDLKTGQQPMYDDDGKSCIVYNGETYNFGEVREELIKLGWNFRTQSDTEVILKAYLQWGASCLDRFRGMFALAIWDERTKSLFLARDRVGIKPIYYYADQNKFLFGSEIKAILQDKSIDRTIDYSAMREYLQYGYVPSPSSIYNRIKKLPPAHWLHITFDGDKHNMKNKCYWDIQFGQYTDGAHNDTVWIDKIESVVSDSVRMHMISDVPVGSFLSGGIDSTIVSHFMAKHVGAINTFTISMNESKFDESAYARQVSAIIQSRHVEKSVQATDLNTILSNLVYAYDEPFADSSAVPTYQIAKIIRSHVTVALSGDGGDEVFGGYKRYEQLLEWSQSNSWLNKDWLSKIATFWPQSILGKNYLRFHSQSDMTRYYGMINIFHSAQIADMMKFPVEHRERLFDSYMNSSDALLNKMQNIDMHTYLPENGLTKVDRASMAHSIEVRVPLLDHKVIELAAQMPVSMRMRKSEKKYVLKKILEPQFPKELIYRNKRGFSLPMRDWFKSNPDLTRMIHREIMDCELIKEHMNLHFIETMITTHLNSSKNHASRIWSLWFLARWYDTYYKKM